MDRSESPQQYRCGCSGSGEYRVCLRFPIRLSAPGEFRMWRQFRELRSGPCDQTRCRRRDAVVAWEPCTISPEATAEQRTRIRVCFWCLAEPSTARIGPREGSPTAAAIHGDRSQNQRNQALRARRPIFHARWSSFRTILRLVLSTERPEPGAPLSAENRE